jgi:hypothetical protein
MAQDIDIAIAGAQLEITVFRRQPAVEDIYHLHPSVADMKTPRCLLTPIARITLNPDRQNIFRHALPPHPINPAANRSFTDSEQPELLQYHDPPFFV